MPRKIKNRSGSRRTKTKNFHKKTLVLYLVLSFVFVLIPIISKLAKIINPPCANSISCIKDLSGAYDPQRRGVFMGQEVVAPNFLASDIIQSQVLGKTSGPKHISVDLTKQRLYAHEGDKKVFEFPVSTGKWGRTPTGDYKIWIKLRYTRMEGGSGSDYYNLPNVPYVMFFYNNEVSKSRGFSLHGAYWHNNFGYPMSHGCVNIRPEDAAKLYEWADPAVEGNITHATTKNPGTSVTIYGQTPI